MHRFDFFLTGCVIICAILEVPYTVAIYGKNVVKATDDEFSFAVFLKIKRTNQLVPRKNLIFCTGSLISPKHVLTAEHCLRSMSPNEIKIIIGSVSLERGESYSAETWITYDWWNSNEDDPWTLHDIAIITLNEAVKNEDVKVAKLLLSAPFTRQGAKLKIAGWGEKDDRTRPTNLKTANVTFLSREECKQKSVDLNDDYHLNMIAQDLCTWADPPVLVKCGDSGGPLVNEYHTVIGVTVGTCPKIRNEGTSLPRWNSHRFNIHLSVYYYNNFIMSVIKDYL